MTEIGETIAIGILSEEDLKCPFDHDEPKPPKVDNDLIGDGGTLGRRMKGGKSTMLYDKLKPAAPLKAIENPRDVKNHPFEKKGSKHAEPVKVQFNDGSECCYPVTCAAHHCVPAQESLKESPLLTFMVKKGDKEPLKDGEKTIQYADGEVWSDLGYDVNGSENGIYLPGSYKVGGGRGGLGAWFPNDDPDADFPDTPDDAVKDANYKKLEGVPGQISKKNPLWWYVGQAVQLCPGQFHDRHEDYSEQVQKTLQAIFENYLTLYAYMIDEKKCGDCKKRVEKFKNDGLPTPYGLVERLNKVSSKYASWVNAAGWHANVYTSKWGQQYMIALKDPTKKKDAKMFG